MAENTNAKPDLAWRAVGSRNPRTGEATRRGQLVLKEYSVGQLFDFGAASGFFPAGAKKEVTVPAFQQMLAAAKSLIETTGNARIPLSSWISLYPRLRNATLTEAGELPATAKIRMYCGVLDDLKVNRDSFHLVRDGGDGTAPRIDFLISDAAGAVRGEWRKSTVLDVNGTHLALGDGDTATVGWLGEDDEPMSITVTPTLNGANLLKFAWPATLDGVAVGTEVTVTLKVKDAESGSVKTARKTAKIVAA